MEKIFIIGSGVIPGIVTAITAKMRDAHPDSEILIVNSQEEALAMLPHDVAQHISTSSVCEKQVQKTPFEIKGVKEPLPTDYRTPFESIQKNHKRYQNKRNR